MDQKLAKNPNGRNLLLCSITTFILFFIGSLAILTYLIADRFLPKSVQISFLSIELSVAATVVISLIAIPLGYAYMFFFGGILSTKAIRLYLFITRGKTVITTKTTELNTIQTGRGLTLALKRQATYFAFILAVVVSFAFYMGKHGVLPIASPVTRTSDVISLLTQDYITLTMSGSILIPAVALALPYFGGLRLRTIDVGPFHTTVLSFIIGASGGFTLLYSILARPAVSLLFYYLLLFMGVCWCFALGCNLAADPANRQIVKDVLSQKATSKLISSKIWIENPLGKLVEV